MATGPTGFLVPTAPNSHKGWAPNLESGVREQQTSFCQEKDHATRFPFRPISPRCVPTIPCRMTRFTV